MTTRDSLNQCIDNAEQALQYAKEQLDRGKQQEHYNMMEYSDAQLQLEQAVMALEKMEHNANEQQRERIDRALIQLRNMQHEMITTPH